MFLFVWCINFVCLFLKGDGVWGDEKKKSLIYH